MVQACERLLASRVEMKMKSKKVTEVLNKLHLATPASRDEKDRPAFIPEAAQTRAKYDPNDPSRPKLERDLETEGGGAGKYNLDLKSKAPPPPISYCVSSLVSPPSLPPFFLPRPAERYLLDNAEWKYDAVPEIWDGKNIADFVDPEIEAKLLALEREEDELEAKGFYESEEEMEDSGDEEIRELASKIKDKKKMIVTEHRMRKNTHKNKPLLPRKANAKNHTTEDFGEHLESMGLDASGAVATAAENPRKRARSLSRANEEESETKRHRSRSTSRMDLSLHDEGRKTAVIKLSRTVQRQRNRFGRAGEGDHHIVSSKPKHLFSGKRTVGKNDRR